MHIISHNLSVWAQAIIAKSWVLAIVPGLAMLPSPSRSADEPLQKITSSVAASAPIHSSDEASGKADVRAIVRQRALDLSKGAFEEPAKLDLDWLPKSYDGYRKLVFDPNRARWKSDDKGFEVHLLPAGWLFKQGVRLWLVDEGRIEPARASRSDFIDGRPGEGDTAPSKPSGGVEAVPLSGFRINWPLNEPGKSDEVIVFQGASYFRALARGQRYGLSARGLAIGTASNKGEEFPMFREFWIERPEKDALEITVHGLLDSPSATGAYRFVIRPGDATVIDVESTLYPRRKIEDIGLAPLTSMFMVGPADRRRVNDFRPQVHDSDGLAIANGRGELLWRPLTNPQRLQLSSFVDNDNKGFGLAQRARDFRDYQDLEAHYEMRPTAWIEPLSDFGKGRVVLVEIPTELEIHDNVVAFWRPEEPLLPGKTYEVRYRMHWQDHIPTREKTYSVMATRSGLSHFAKGDAPTHLFVIDYEHASGKSNDSQAASDIELPKASVSSSTGVIENVVVRENPKCNGFRVSFEFKPNGAEQAELRLNLSGLGGLSAENWLYRWAAAQ